MSSIPSPAGGKAAKGSVAAVLVTSVNEVRRYLDGALRLADPDARPPRTGDYLCADGRYRLGDVEGERVRRSARSRSSASCGGRRRRRRGAKSSAREQSTVQRELEQTRAAHALERDAATQAEQRARALSEVAHMLDEVEQRRIEMRALREAEEQSSVGWPPPGARWKLPRSKRRTRAHAGPTRRRPSRRWRIRRA